MGDNVLFKFRGSVVGCLVAASVGMSVLGASPAQALSSGLAFSADHLSTWQANGVAYATTGAKGKVFVGGSFAQIRPPSGTAAPIATPGLAILDADSGAPSTCQLPATLGGGTPTVYALNTSPDGNTVYVGGNFSAIGGVSRSRVAAIDVASCTVKPLSLSVSSLVYGLTSTDNTLYIAGLFTSVGGQVRQRFAAVNATTGALLPWVANADAAGRAIAVSPDRTKVAIGGDFFNVNAEYSHSIAVVDAATGKNLRTYPAGFIPNTSVTKSIVSDATGFYVGNEGSGGGVFDGRLAVDWSTLNERWRDNCLGATQAVLPYEGTLYSASHAHDCGSTGYFQDGKRNFFLAQSTADRSFRSWFPTANDGIGEGIGPRGLAVATGTSGAKYLYAVGEFTTINGASQQSITRFGTKDTGAPAAPFIQAEALTSNAIQVRVLTPVDADDESLTYTITRTGNGTTNQVWTGKATSWWWSRPQITFTDTNVAPGKSYTYRVTASDGLNTSPLSGGVVATAATKVIDYPGQVIADGANLYWRFDEPSGTRIWNKGVDSTSGLNGLLAKGPTLGAAGAVGSNPAATFDGIDDFAWNDQFRPAPSVYTMETWIKTTTTRGGRIIGYTESRPRTDTGAPLIMANYDRHIYMENTGNLAFGVSNGGPVVLRSGRAYNDGNWHHLVGSQGPSGMEFYVDGVRVGRNTTSTASSYRGVWKVGGDRLAGWPNPPASTYFAGQIDETAVYEGSVLSSTKVTNHYKLSGRGGSLNPAPAEPYAAAVYTSGPEFYWPLNETSGLALDKSLAGTRPGTVGTSVVRRRAATVGDGFGIGTVNNANSLVYTTTPETAPASFSTEIWFNTTSSSGGKLIGFENTPTSTTSTGYDKHLYLTNSGAVVFGVHSGSLQSISSAVGLNNGRWHQVVGTQGREGTRLYVDGVLVASGSPTTNQIYSGYWRVGGGNLANWPSRPSASYLTGSLDEAAVYDHSLTAAEVSNHYALGVKDTQRPSAPAAPTAAVASPTRINLAWQPATDNIAVARYRIHRGTAADFTPNAGSRVAEVTATNWSDATVSAGTWYYKITAVDTAGNEGVPAAASATIPDTTAPTAPAGLVGQPESAGVTLTWTAATDDVAVTAYDVYRGATPGYVRDATTKIGQATQPTFADKNMPAGGYYYAVVARDAAGNRSADSSELRYTQTDVSPPSQPADLAAGVKVDEITLTWASSTDTEGVTGYVVYRGGTADFDAKAASQVGTSSTSSFVDANRPSGVAFYRVAARDGAGNLSTPTDSVRTEVADLEAPETPANLQAKVSGSTVALSWGASADNVATTRYEVFRSDSATFTAVADNRIGTTAPATFSDSGRPTGTWYYRVIAVDAADNVSVVSAPVSAQVDPAAAAPAEMSLSPAADTMVAENNPGGLYGSNNQLSTRGPGSGSEAQAYARFDLSGLPSGSQIVSASLQMTTSNDPTASSTGATVVKLLSAPWSEATTTWTNRPTSFGPTLGTLTSAPTLNKGYAVDLDAAQLHVDGSGQLSVALVGLSTDNLRINAREGTTVSGRPILKLAYKR